MCNYQGCATMLKLNKKIKMKLRITQLLKSTTLVMGSLLLVVGFVISPYVQANQYEQQINELDADSSAKRENVNKLQVQAESYQGEISRLQIQINGIREQIKENEAKRDDLQAKIVAAEIELEKQKDLLGQNIKAIYVEGDITPLEMLASSNNLSEFLDRQQYRESVQSKIKTTLDKINELKAQLKAQKELVENLLNDQKIMNNSLTDSQIEQNRLLAFTEGQKSAYESQIKSNNTQINELRRQQAIENAKLFGGTPGTGPACGGGYPGSAPGPWGAWGCNYPLDHSIDSWGMYNRECVSYTAYKVAASGRHMPYWGGRGNANQWDNNAIKAGIPVDRNPRVGDVAVSNAGYYGHTMYVEHVYGDGRILISQYNGGWDGTYSEAVISTGNLVFIHFP